MPDLSAHAWWLGLAAALCAGLSKSGFGPFGLLTVILMAEILPARESTGVVLPLLIFADLLAVRSFQEHASWPALKALLPATGVGIITGWWIMPAIPSEFFWAHFGLDHPLSHRGHYRPTVAPSTSHDHHHPPPPWHGLRMGRRGDDHDCQCRRPHHRFLLSFPKVQQNGHGWHGRMVLLRHQHLETPLQLGVRPAQRKVSSSGPDPFARRFGRLLPRPRFSQAHPPERV